ncbi:immunoglobulin superfamily member 6 isoform X2 [Oncorhynchus keta]|uniref:immunoglobulin superfamily member 6 isoform X2 n=1 Tax=Oncorhynchus keta TaxID=8018 RepID=UPI00227CAC93|nr:immunoglobulin superfamily member 6 isoform X2 [Oncorhynchus keta]
MMRYLVTGWKTERSENIHLPVLSIAHLVMRSQRAHTHIVSTLCFHQNGFVSVLLYHANESRQPDTHHSVDLMTQQHKYSLERNSLNINSLQANDSGVYHCAALFRDVVCSGAQEIGQGTTLVVRERGVQMAWQVLLFVLLALYSLAILILIIRKKTGKDIAVCRGTQKSDIQKNKVRVQFGAVVQELYGKRNLRSNKKNPNHSGPAQNKVESPHSNHPEDIYQNQ